MFQGTNFSSVDRDNRARDNPNSPKEKNTKYKRSRPTCGAHRAPRFIAGGGNRIAPCRNPGGRTKSTQTRWAAHSSRQTRSLSRNNGDVQRRRGGPNTLHYGPGKIRRGGVGAETDHFRLRLMIPERKTDVTRPVATHISEQWAKNKKKSVALGKRQRKIPSLTTSPCLRASDAGLRKARSYIAPVAALVYAKQDAHFYAIQQEKQEERQSPRVQC